MSTIKDRNGMDLTETEDTERLLSNHAKTLGSLAFGAEEFNPGPEMRLDCSELLCKNFIKV